MEMFNLAYTEYFFPLSKFKVTKRDGNIDSNLIDVMGTAFYIGGGIFMTAWHVLAGALDGGCIPALNFRKKDVKGQLESVLVDVYEYSEDHDLAVFTLQHPVENYLVSPFQWSSHNFNIFHPIASIGYPYSYDFENNSIYGRGYMGTVVTNRKWRDKNDYLKAQPQIIELSFIAPKGISGAPVLSYTKKELPLIGGVILGNIGKYSEVIRGDSELTNDGLIMQETKFFHGFGIAYNAIKNLSFGDLIQTSLEAHLIEHDLLKSTL